MRALFLLCSLLFAINVAVAQENKLHVVTTTSMIADAAVRIGGTRITVKALMGQGVDPHTYKASPGDVRTLADADLILSNGLHLEGKLSDVLSNLARRKAVYEVSDTIDRSILRQPAEFQGQYDPHIWFDVQLWITVVERIKNILIERDEKGKEYYSTQASQFISELQELHSWIHTQIDTIPVASRLLVTAHDAFGYFGRAYNIEVHGIQGISTDSEASIRDINALVDLLVSRKVRAVFIESSVPHKTIEALIEGAQAKGHTVLIGGELFSDAMGTPGTIEGTYIGMVRHNVTSIVRGLSGK